MEIAVIGKEDFCLGFRLTGIKKIVETSKPEDVMQFKSSEVGIVILDESLFEIMEGDDKESLSDSLKPIYIILSKQASDDSLKRMIRKSIGVEV